jgi:hypothetical protein
MAISDVLFEAALEIKECLNNGIGKYDDPQIRAEIDKCLAEMERVQRLLDSPLSAAEMDELLRDGKGG